MKTCKKLLAVLLSLMMIASVIVIPATAEETAAENYVSLLDMSGLRAGVFTQDDNTAFPDGLADLGVSRAHFGGTGSDHYSGKQEIVKLEDGSNAWKINFNKAMTGGGWYWDNKGLFVAQVAVPQNMVPYITSIKLDMINGANGHLQYQVGVTSGSSLAKSMKESSGSNATPDAPVELNLSYDITTLGKRSAYDAFNGGGTVIGNIDPSVDPISSIYFSLKDAEAADGGLGYAIIKDIGVTLSIPVEDIPVAKEYSIFDLSEATVGATHTGDNAIIADVAAIGVSKFSSGWNASHAYTGTQEIVEVDGKKAWKINWDVAMKSNSNLCDVANEFMIKLPIPAKYAKYVTGVKADITNAAATQTGVAFGFYDGSKVSWKSGNNSYDQTVKPDVTDVVLERNIVDLKVRPDLYAGCPTLTEAWTVGSATDVYLVMVSQGCNGTEGGYAIIKDIKLTVSAAPSVHENMPIDKEFSIFDLSSAPLGTVADYPDGMAAFKHSATDAVQKVIETESGKKALEIDLVSGGFTGGDSRLTAQDGKQGYSPWYGIGIDIPGGYIPYVTAVTFKVTKNTNAGICYNFGVTDGASFSKKGAGENTTMSAATTGEQTITYTMDQLNKVNDWYFSRWGGGSDKWAANFNKVYLVFGATEATGTFVINDVIIHTTASQSQYDNMPMTEKVDMWDLSANELGEVTKVKYNKGVSDNNYSGAMEIVEAANGEKALRLDFDKTTFNGTGGRIKEHGYSPVYQVQLAVLPSTYVPYIDNINVKLDIQSESNIPYSFGVTDGSNYSKDNTNWNNSFSGTKGIKIVSYAPENLYKVGSWSAGAYGGTSVKWNGDDFTALYLWITADAGSTGYVDILDFSFTMTATAAQKAEANAKWAEMKAYVNNFESSGSESVYATSGTKVQSIWSGNGYSGGDVTLNTNIYIDEANGFSFWMYNPNETAQSPKLWLNTNSGTRYIISTGYSIAAKSYAKVIVDFNNVYEWAGDDGGYSKGALISLTEEQKADISKMTVMIRPGSTSILVDDVYLIFDEIKTTTTSELEVTTDNVTGATVEDGKIKFASTAEGSDIVAEITVPDKFFSHASSMTLNFDSDVAAEVAVSLLGTNDSGNEVHWKWGYQDQSTTVAAGGIGVDKTFNFAGYNGTYNNGVIHEGSGVGSSLGTNCNQCTPPSSWGGSSNHSNNPPTPTEKENITTIVVHVFNNLGTEGQAVTLNSIDVTYAGNNVTAETVEGGVVSVVESKVWAGDTGSFIVAPAEGYYLKTISVVDNLGNEIEATHSDGKEATNLGYYYTFTMPVGHVTIKAEFVAIEGTMPMVPAYDGNNLVLDYTVPFVENKVYNESTYEFETLGDYGVLIASDVALEKYGYTVEDLTPEFVDEIIESGHHLANFIYKLDGKKAVKTENNANTIRFTIEVTDVSIRARRAPFALATYAEFTNDEGAESTPVNTFNYNTMDMLVYGDNLVEEFYANNGINYQSSLTADLSVWEDIYNQGFDHIRLPITMTGRMDEEFNIIDEKMADVDYAIDNALKAGFSVVIDTHSLGVNISGDYENSVDAYYKVWEQLAERYKNLPLSVAFQFVNEPMTNRKTETAEDGTVINPDPLTDDELMEFQEKLVKDCRAVEGNEDRYMVISNHNNGSWALGQFTDSILALGNIIVDIHYYHPMSFTHSGSDTWAGNKENGGGYPSGATEYSQADIVSFVTKCANFAETNGVTVWVGEWGAYQPDYTAKIAYYADFAKAASDAGITWSLWEYGSGFSPYKNGAWDKEILDAIFLFDGVNNTVAE